VPRVPDLAAVARIYETEMSEGDRSCFMHLLGNPASLQATSAGTGHCKLYEQLATAGWAALDPPSDLTRAAASTRVWRLTDEGRARIPTMLFALTVNDQVRQLQARRMRHLVTFGALLIGVTLGLYAAVFPGLGALLPGTALKLMDALAALVLMAVLAVSLWLAVKGWAERPVKVLVLFALGRLEFLKANRLAVAAAMAVALALIGVSRVWLGHWTGEALPAPILLAVQASVHAVLGFAVGRYVGTMIIDARISRQFPARR
jgi:hypothetical protein